MPTSPPLLQTRLEGLRPLHSGKVRDLYEAGDDLLIVATDRISAFDYVLGSGIPDKGKVLTQLSVFWFGLTADLMANHVIATRPEEYPPAARRHSDVLRGRSMLVRRTSPIPIECVVRGYLAGSAWQEYRETRSVCGLPLPGGLQECDRLAEPLFTPATKAATGHDENITESQAGEMVGHDVVARLRQASLAVYRRAAAHAESRGIIVADTKFEFGLLQGGGGSAGALILIDEALTPDSSRFWPIDQYRTGRSQPSFDKQFVRDYLEGIRWNKQPPVPTLPDDVVVRTREKYLEAFRRLTGHDLE